MVERGAAGVPAELILFHALEKLRARDGVKSSRLQLVANGIAAPLLALSAVHRHSGAHDVDLARAAVDILGGCVRDGLKGTDRIVADAVLGLGLFAGTYLDHGIDRRVVDGLHAGLLSRRRTMLLGCWRGLHEALDVPPIEPPSDRALRGSLEVMVLTELAHQLARRELYSLVPRPAPSGVASGNGRRPRGRVVVAGGAVIDATFKTRLLPQKETSTEAWDFSLTPGGKGVTQAVAAARLGLDVSLFAAVADDHFGEEIMNYLERENVDTRLVKVVAGGRSPFTGIIELELGDSAAVNWRNDREVRIDVRDVEERASALADCDAALVTFELPRESMQRVLAVLDRAEPRPTVIVTPSQPYSEGVVPGQAFAQIDYLVAHPWELGRYAPSDQPAFKPDEVAVRMLANGVKTVCYPIGGGCSVYSEGPLGTFAVPSFPTQYRESSAARDAFCAALAAKLIEEHGAFSEGIALWATAAMAAAAADYPLQNPMPDRNRIEGMLSRSRFLVAPRADLNGAAGGGLPG